MGPQLSRHASTMTYPVIRRRVWSILDAKNRSDTFTRWTAFFLLTLIVLNVSAVIVGSMRAVEAEYGKALWVFEIFSVVIFSLEYLARLWSCVSQEEYRHPIWGRLRYMVTPMAIIDFLAILPFYLMFFAFDLRFIRALRVFRLLRVAKLGRYSAALRLLVRVVVNRKEELLITIMLMFILVIIAASFIYYAEQEAQPEHYSDIPSSMWWSIVTLTTVGYGDVYPITPLGKAFAALSAIFGVGMVALPTGILGASFVEELRKQREGERTCPHCGKVID